VAPSFNRAPDGYGCAVRRSTSVTLGVTALLAAGLTGCGSSGDDVNAVCVDAQTQQRVDDDQCDDDAYNGSVAGSAFLWYFLGRASAVPAFGVPIRGYAGGFSAPSNLGGVRTGLPQAGAKSGYTGGKVTKVSRGGFGSSGGKSGG
jgi:hypothetical protein